MPQIMDFMVCVMCDAYAQVLEYCKSRLRSLTTRASLEAACSTVRGLGIGTWEILVAEEESSDEEDSDVDGESGVGVGGGSSDARAP